VQGASLQESSLPIERSGAPELWFLQVQRASRLSPWAFGLLAGAVIFVLVVLPPVSAGVPPAAVPDLLASAAFFATSLGFLFGAAPVIFPAAARDFERLRPVLELDAVTADRLGRALVRLPSSRVLGYAALGTLFGCVHALLVVDASGSSRAESTPAVATVLLWVMMFQIAPPMLANAGLFDRLASRVQPDLLRIHQLYPFGSAAVRPTLFVIGLQCAYPLLALGSAEPIGATNLIGLGVSALLVGGLFFLPLRGIRRRISAAREQVLASLDARVARFSLDEGAVTAAMDAPLAELESLLALRERVARVSSWPLGHSGLKRVALYVILPPLTWVGAALVERMLELGF
jgi:hypothetical protein